VLGVNFGGNPLLPNGCGPLMDWYGPQADLLLTNTTSCTFGISLIIEQASAYVGLDPGASMSMGFALQSTGVNMLPAPIVVPSIFFGGQNKTNLAAAFLCDLMQGLTFIEGPVLTLTPGDFVWISIRANLYITGAGPATGIVPVGGEGPQIHLRGLRL
jgi:hypothetical protein